MKRERITLKRHLGLTVDVMVWTYGGGTAWVEVRRVDGGGLVEKKRFTARHSRLRAEQHAESRFKSLEGGRS